MDVVTLGFWRWAIGFLAHHHRLLSVFATFFIYIYIYHEDMAKATNVLTLEAMQPNLTVGTVAALFIGGVNKPLTTMIVVVTT